MALFARLLSLHGRSRPTEDFFTEIVAHLLDRRPAFAKAWLIEMGIRAAHDLSINYVTTQVTYSALGEHATDSRPDLQIGLSNADRRMVVFVESKIGSSEGPDQLKRYAEILSHISPADDRVLSYVTRRYDQKDAEDIEAHCTVPVMFIQSRWHQFYRLLALQDPDPFISEVLRFMEITGMAHPGTFDPSDLLALQRLPQALSVVKETLWGDVSAEFERVLRKRPNERSTNAQLGHHGRYILMTWMRDKWWCGLGYAFRPEYAYPRLGVVLEVAPSSPARSEILRRMNEIEDRRDGWHGWALREEGSWSGVGKMRGLESFLGEQDQVHTIRMYFKDLLRELSAIQREYPDLPWLPSVDDDDES